MPTDLTALNNLIGQQVKVTHMYFTLHGFLNVTPGNWYFVDTRGMEAEAAFYADDVRDIELDDEHPIIRL